LERVWRKTETVPGLVLAEPDFISLAPGFPGGPAS
jgi:hypothetical protein